MSAGVLYFDLETYRTRDEQVIESIRAEVAKKKPAKSWTKAETAAFLEPGAFEARLAAELSSTAKDPGLAEILCIAVAFDDGEPQSISAMGEGRSEAQALEAFVGLVQEHGSEETVWCAHNAEGFDLRVLLNRARRHRIAPGPMFPRFYRGRWFGTRIADTMLMVPSSSGANTISLVDACVAMGLPAPKTAVALEDGRALCGALVGHAFETGQHEAILRYCVEDIQALRRLHQVCTFGGTWGTWAADSALEEDLDSILGTPLQPQTKLRMVLEHLATTGRIPARYATVK